jgi:hypothetical protein
MKKKYFLIALLLGLVITFSYAQQDLEGYDIYEVLRANGYTDPDLLATESRLLAEGDIEGYISFLVNAIDVHGDDIRNSFGMPVNNPNGRIPQTPQEFDAYLVSRMSDVERARAERRFQDTVTNAQTNLEALRAAYLAEISGSDVVATDKFDALRSKLHGFAQIILLSGSALAAVMFVAGKTEWVINVMAGGFVISGVVYVLGFIVKAFA